MRRCEKYSEGNEQGLIWEFLKQKGLLTDYMSWKNEEVDNFTEEPKIPSIIDFDDTYLKCICPDCGKKFKAVSQNNLNWMNGLNFVAWEEEEKEDGI